MTGEPFRTIARNLFGRYQVGLMRRLHADLLLLLAAAVWGFAFYFQKTAMDHVGPFLFIAARAGVAALALAPLIFAEAHRAAAPTPAKLSRIGVAAGLAFFVAATLQQTGLVTATVTNSGFLTALYVIITPLLAWGLLRKAPTPCVWPGVALAFIGTWLLGGGTVGGFSAGDGLVALSAVFWAGHLLITAASAPYGRPITFSTLQFAVVALCALVGAVAAEPITLTGLSGAAPAIAFVGLLSSALTFTLLAVAMKHTPPSEAAILISAETLFAAMAGAVFLGERLSGIGWLGAGMMFAAMLLIQLGPLIDVRLKRGQPT
jgi:drug/metabolite transporter (DMT)-like permease